MNVIKCGAVKTIVHGVSRYALIAGQVIERDFVRRNVMPLTKKLASSMPHWTQRGIGVYPSKEPNKACMPFSPLNKIKWLPNLVANSQLFTRGCKSGFDSVPGQRYSEHMDTHSGYGKCRANNQQLGECLGNNNVIQLQEDKQDADLVATYRRNCGKEILAGYGERYWTQKKSPPQKQKCKRKSRSK